MDFLKPPNPAVAQDILAIGEIAIPKLLAGEEVEGITPIYERKDGVQHVYLAGIPYAKVVNAKWIPLYSEDDFAAALWIVADSGFEQPEE